MKAFVYAAAVLIFAVNGYKDCSDKTDFGQTFWTKIAGDWVELSCFGDWTIIGQRPPSENFNRSFGEYETGFKTPTGGEWLGLKYISALTLTERYRLELNLISVAKSPVTTVRLQYNNFRVKNYTSDYKLDSLGNFTSYSALIKNGVFDNYVDVKFSAFNKDNDGNSLVNGAAEGGGGWWYPASSKDDHCNLNKLINPYCDSLQTVHWIMKIRPFGLSGRLYP